MENYKHISFDLWLTLIKSNPDFKLNRDLMFFNNYNPNHVSLETVRHIVRKVDIKSNEISEQTGLHVPSLFMLNEILSDLEYKNINMTVLIEIHEKIQNLFIEYSPIFYDDTTKGTLLTLFTRGIRLSILSNTGFICGKTLETVLIKLEISHLFAFKIFSDVVGLAKPNPEIFKKIDYLSPFKTSEILHVGDNPVADGGSITQGITYFQINTNNKTILDLL